MGGGRLPEALLTAVILGTMGIIGVTTLSDIGSYSITDPGDPFYETSRELLPNAADGIILLFLAVGLAGVVLVGLVFITSISGPTRGSGR